MVKKRKTISIIYLVLISLIVFQADCSKQSEEDVIVETLEKLADRAEDKEIEEVLSLISIKYSDQENRSKKEIRELVEKYLARYQGIVIHLLQNKIQLMEVNQAAVQVDVALSHGAAKLMRQLVRVGTTFYRFHLTMHKEETIWRVRDASWERVSVNELYPESRERINRIFPDVF